MEQALVAETKNEVGFDDPTPTDHDFLGAGLRKAVYNYMHGLGLEEDVRSWFAQPGRRDRQRARPTQVPRTTVPPDLIRRALMSGMRER